LRRRLADLLVAAVVSSAVTLGAFVLPDPTVHPRMAADGLGGRASVTVFLRNGGTRACRRASGQGAEDAGAAQLSRVRRSGSDGLLRPGGLPSNSFLRLANVKCAV
jgi:hypothetical protein